MRIPNSRFDRLVSSRPTERLPQYAGQRIRIAGVIVRLEARRPVEVMRVSCFYLHIDCDGFVDYETYMEQGALAVEAVLGGISLPDDKGSNVIRAGHRFAARRRDHEAVWTPIETTLDAIREAALDDPKYSRVRSVPAGIV